MEVAEIYMARCLQLAQKGIGSARPNPSVGCVIVCDDRVIGEGFTSAYGGNHAEVNAILSVEDTSLLKKATLYVTLEPCAHYGKTPPCANLIVEHKIPNVVIGCVDTNSVVSGKGIEHLIANGCDVKVGVLEQECIEQHKRFFMVQNKNRPYIILKWAETLDGFIAPEKRDIDRPVWISNSYAQQLVHKWRSEEHAILVGTETAIADNPKLDVRKWGGTSPIRFVLDRTGRIPISNPLLDNSIKTIVCVDNTIFKSKTSKDNVIYEAIDFKKNLTKNIVNVLMKHSIQSIIIEGGSQTLQTFINEGMWDEARVFIGDVKFKKGVKAPVLSVTSKSNKMIKNTELRVFENLKNKN